MCRWEAMAKKNPRQSKTANSDFDLSERIRYLRGLRNLSQIELARMSNVAQATIAQIESGRKDPSVSTLRKVAAALDVCVATLFSTDEIHVFDLPRLRRKYSKAKDLNATLYRALDQVLRFAKDIGF